MMQAEALKCYSLRVNADGSLADPTQHPHHHSQASGTPVPAEQILHEKATALSAEQGLDYGTALARVMAHPNHRELMKAYHAADERRPATKPARVDASQELDRKTRELMAKEQGLSYSEAAALVIKRNGALATKWNGA